MWFATLLGISGPLSEVIHVASCPVGSPLPPLTPQNPATATAIPRISYTFVDVMPSPNYLPFATPTPTTSPCPLCGYEGGSGGQNLHVTLDDHPSFPDPVTNAVVAIEYSQGWMTFGFPPVSATSTTTVTLSGAPNELGRRAVLMFSVGDVGYISEIPVIATSQP